MEEETCDWKGKHVSMLTCSNELDDKTSYVESVNIDEGDANDARSVEEPLTDVRPQRNKTLIYK